MYPYTYVVFFPLNQQYTTRPMSGTLATLHSSFTPTRQSWMPNNGTLIRKDGTMVPEPQATDISEALCQDLVDIFGPFLDIWGPFWIVPYCAICHLMVIPLLRNVARCCKK